MAVRRWRLGGALPLAALILAGCGGAGPARQAATTVVTTPVTTPPPSTTTPPPVTTGTTSTTRPVPRTVTTITLHLVDRFRPTVSQGRTISDVRDLTTMVWLPPLAGPRPLIVFGPGFDVSPAPYEDLLLSWAQRGFVVAALEFPLADPEVAGPYLDENDLPNEPGDLRYVTDALTAPTSPLAGRIDAGRVVVAGHSDGSEAALAAAVTPPPPGQPAYRAVIAMSVQPLPSTYGDANPPILVTQGDADTINPPAWGFDTWQAARPPKYYLVLHGGGHLPPLEAGSPWLPAVEAVTGAFLDCYAGAGTPPSAIAAAAARWPATVGLTAG